MIEKNLIEIYENSFRNHWDKVALSDYGGKKQYTYAELAQRIALWHLMFKEMGLKPGDKVALMGKDNADWCVMFMSILTYGTVLVPILPDFSPVDTQAIVEHSDSKAVFIADNFWAKLKPSQFHVLRYAIGLNSGSVLWEKDGDGKMADVVLRKDNIFAAAYPEGFKVQDVRYHHTPNSDMVLLNYTSGTTGFSKGVMLTGNNLAGNIVFAQIKKILLPGEDILCFLPLAHAYSCTFNLFLAMAQGAHLHLLGRIPAPSVLLKAFADVKPRLILSVPLVLERIYRDIIAPKLNKPAVKTLMKIPFVKRLILSKIRKSLDKGLGDNFREVIIGGAAMNDEVARFLKKIDFHFTIGYGMTECAPLISYAPWREWRIGSCGRPLDGYMEARIDYTGYEGQESGEIQVRGENVCLGYFKKPELTEELFTADGWMHTGDLGTMDEDGFIYIKGRSKAMLLSANGQNIFPETIESKLNMCPLVLESLVISDHKRLIALVVPNEDAIKKQGLTPEAGWAEIEAFRDVLNEQLGSYEKVVRFERQNEPFVKTPKQSIKRFLYTRKED